MQHERTFGGRVRDILERLVSEGHCTRIGNSAYVTDDNNGKELSPNFDLANVANQLGLSEFLQQACEGAWNRPG